MTAPAHDELPSIRHTSCPVRVLARSPEALCIERLLVVQVHTDDPSERSVGLGHLLLRDPGSATP